MSVLGFDIGNEDCVIAAVRQGGIDILLNEESKRESPALVSFAEKQRLMGSVGAASAMMNPKSTITQLKRMIGMHFKDPDFQTDLKMLPFETFEGPGGGILISLPYMGTKHTFTPVQVLAMLLAHLKRISEKSLEIPVSDCVIGIPSYFTNSQRRAYLDAAAIAGLKSLRLMHDCTATALGYGIYKTEFVNHVPTYVVFVDIGHCDTQVCVASFEPGQMKILSHAFDKNLGGRDFDRVLFNYFVARFKEKYKIDVSANVRASTRLRASCEKLKKVLSANAEAPLSIECLMDEKDVQGFIKREEFEKLSSSLLDRVVISCRRALDDARLTEENIHYVELIGSGSRIPAIARVVASFFNREPSRTLNSSECVARGCALQCAMLSPVIRVRDYEVQDSLPFSMGLSTNEGPIHTLSDSVLFPKGHLFPSIKILTLHRANTFTLEALYSHPNEFPSGARCTISTFMIGPFQASTGRTKVKVKAHLDLHGMIALSSASLIEDITDATNTKNTEADVSRRFSKMIGGTRKPSNERRCEIPISEPVIGGMTSKELREAIQRELQLVQQDVTMEHSKYKKNALESYVYEMREKVLNTYRSFSTDSEKVSISRGLQQTEEWLYEDGNDESEAVYSKKLDDLKKLVDPIENRFKDEESRAEAIRGLRSCIVDCRMAIKSLSDAQKEAVTDVCDKAEQWLQERTQLQNLLPKNADPILWSSEIIKHAKSLDMICKNIMKPGSDTPISDADVAGPGRKSSSL